MNVFNQFSFPLMAAGVLALVYVVLRRRLAFRWVISVEIVIVVVLVGTFFALRPGEGDVDSAEALDDLLGSGQPVMVEFFSNFCTVCLVFRPRVDEIDSEFGDDYNIVRVNIHSEAGQRIREAFEFSFTPEFILFDGAGIEVWRDHTPPSDAQLTALLAG
ncbi:MAG: hypothetical protein IT298_09245 [Chloroflexi bacterium]|jgi:thiol-disulfide isomerase/thioredoxin|nr:MAG: Thioredoxin C-1 [Chloroflexi bacterium OLB13]MBC6955395.1 hypothetical protein [Chloroflexota bacterium]MBV6435421.1 hypothetical protein [Anaerolineae bacterium]MDL1915287.1 hypothetical protein [Anaerolineae bacterium CFX4]OQY86489.1 MAG: hypothetical protein B6D42_01140 [Anaerolineae bacterium UTCFX5]